MTLLCLAAAAPRSALAQEFLDLTTAGDGLVRGVSEKSDVVLAFGEPQGTGGAMLPTDRTAKEVWYYENIQAQILSLKGRQQVLLVFFKGDLYDGYFWFDVRQDSQPPR